MSADPEREEEGRGAPETSCSGEGEGEGDVPASDDSSEASRLDGWTKEPGDRADAGGAYATLTRYLRRKPGASPRKASTLGNYFRRKPDGGDPSAPQRPGFWHWFGWAPKKPAPKADGQ